MQNNLTKSEIRNKIEDLEKYFSKYKKQDAIKKLEEVKEKLNNQEYKIAVVANMSAGKSTFINALFGKEVLPAFNHATTDSATYIYSKPNIEKKAEIFFSDGRKNITITENLEQDIKQYAQKDEDCKDDKYKNVEKIELYYPFKNLQTSSSEDFNITFIDTPGPNSTGDYGQKHKDQTRSVLNSVDMALFAFDYGQLDANLKSDEQGLWNTIKTRYEKDPNFEVYFLINKIDMAMEDNFKDVKSIDEAKKNWGTHEEKAVEKLIKAAKNYGVNEPKVYTVASKFALLDRDDISWDSPLESFQKKFKQIFESSWESEYIKYLGIVELENDINNYINTSVKEKILKIAFDNIVDVSNDELSTLNNRIQTLSKPKEEATKNVNKALDFLNGEAKELEKDMNGSFNKSSKKAIKETDNLIDTAIEDELFSKIDEMSKKSIAYSQLIALGDQPSSASKKSDINYKKINLAEKTTIELRNNINIDVVLNSMKDYMKSLFEDYKNNYLDIKTDLKNSFVEYEINISKKFRQVKDSLNLHLQNALDLEMQSLEVQTADIDSSLSFEVFVPNSVLDYNHEEYSQIVTRTRTVERSIFNPFRWFGDKYTEEEYQDEEHISRHLLTINPIDLKNSIENSMKETVKSFVEQEKKNYQKAINELKDKNSSIFQDFRHNKQKEINKLQDDIKDSEKNLKVIEKQLEDFNNLTKD
ncbi:MAG: dynamin family protein [Aliarcobacter skirrowii]|uniref:dynamin family protein n=1 Tax=Aliarcobacter skirrowii TaxID=28200 RepID=UPI00242E93BF|nr:dynamin family protein [Aliarcobacter skirrowii]MDD2507561.1 dynamin family protein [Aliarcobacter skirrowii]MDD3495913.1 dynamin family protein [Aliarcobacter skirrowii]